MASEHDDLGGSWHAEGVADLCSRLVFILCCVRIRAARKPCGDWKAPDGSERPVAVPLEPYERIRECT